MPAGGRLVLVSWTAKVFVPLLRYCKTWLCQGLLARIPRYTSSCININVGCGMHRHKHVHTNIIITHTSTHPHKNAQTQCIYTYIHIYIVVVPDIYIYIYIYIYIHIFIYIVGVVVRCERQRLRALFSASSCARYASPHTSRDFTHTCIQVQV
jgi:hypothetical protein